MTDSNYNSKQNFNEKQLLKKQLKIALASTRNLIELVNIYQEENKALNLAVLDLKYGGGNRVQKPKNVDSELKGLCRDCKYFIDRETVSGVCQVFRTIRDKNDDCSEFKQSEKSGSIICPNIEEHKIGEIGL